MKKNIAVIMGGYSSESSISFKSGNVILKNLNKEKYNVYKIHILPDRWIFFDDNGTEFPIDKHNFSVKTNTTYISFDCVFNAIHGSPGEDGLISAYFDLIKIPHTSAPFYQMAITFNKRDCLSILKSHGIKTARSMYFNKGDEIDIQSIINTIGLPCFVKPNKAGSSFGISKVTSPDQMIHAIEKAYKEDSEILIECFLDGTEVSVGVINYHGNIKVLPITEIVSENDFFDYEAKYLGKSQEITPARISDIQKSRVTKIAKKVYTILNMTGFSRSEYILVDNEPYFLEINTVPGFTKDSILPQQANKIGISLPKLFENAIETSLNSL